MSVTGAVLNNGVSPLIGLVRRAMTLVMWTVEAASTPAVRPVTSIALVAILITPALILMVIPYLTRTTTAPVQLMQTRQIQTVMD